MLKYKLGIFDDIKCDHQFYNPVKYYRNDIDLILEMYFVLRIKWKIRVGLSHPVFTLKVILLY